MATFLDYSFAAPSETAVLGAVLALLLIASIRGVWRASDLAPILTLGCFGVIMTIVMGMGLIHPPVSLNLFVIKSITPDVPLRGVIRASSRSLPS